MTTLKLKTDLACGKCVEKLRNVFQHESGISTWDVDLKSPDKTLTVQGDVNEVTITKLVEKAGYHVLGATPNFFKTYYPLILIFAYITGFALLKQLVRSVFSLHGLMLDFMGGFFIVFSFFKFLNLKGFAEAYSTYDVLAKRVRAYGYVYPFLELLLGIAYFARFDLELTSLATFVLMLFSSIGVIQAVVKKSKIQCACLGTIFNLPMTYITFFEDLLMVVMAAIMFFA
ncbi:MAG: heavy-metal-associated domain-containing protein [Bacteriovoracaceae bacterium]|nr:heavy-metal-associated domain-containing protein [Bacteriovoracaceae bacterium]